MLKLVIEYLGFCLLLFTTQFKKPLYLSKSDYLYELSIIAAEAFQRTGQQVFRTVTKNIETNPLDGNPRRQFSAMAQMFRQISLGKNPSNGYPNKLVAPLSGRKKMKNLEQRRTKQQFSWEMNLQHSTLFLIKKIILFYENFLKDGLFLDFQNFKQKLYACIF